MIHFDAGLRAVQTCQVHATLPALFLSSKCLFDAFPKLLCCLSFVPLAEQLLEFMHQLPAFANMTMSVRRELCAVMVFAVVERAGTIVLNDGEEVCVGAYSCTRKSCLVIVKFNSYMCACVHVCGYWTLVSPLHTSESFFVHLIFFLLY